MVSTLLSQKGIEIVRVIAIYKTMKKDTDATTKMAVNDRRQARQLKKADDTDIRVRLSKSTFLSQRPWNTITRGTK